MARYRRGGRSFVGKYYMWLIGGGIVLVTLFTCVGTCGFFAYLGDKNEKAARQDLEEADRLWDAGQKGQAVTKYKAVLDRDAPAVPGESDQARVYARVIDNDVERGDTESARKYIRKALDKKVDLAGVKKGQALVAEVRAQPVSQLASVSDGLELENTVEGVYDGKEFTITGTVANRRIGGVKSVKIVYVLYDENNVKVGTATATTPFVDGGKTWTFRATAAIPQARKYRLSELTCR